MPDFGAPVAQNVNVQPTQTLSNILGIQQQKLALQTGQAELATQQAQASINTRVAQERQNLASVNWKQYVNDDGSYDIDSAEKTALAVAPTTGSDFVERLGKMTEQGAQTKRAYYALNQDYQTSVRSAYGAWAGSDGDIVDLAKQLDTIKENAPASAQKALDQITQHTLSNIAGPDLITGQGKTLAQQKQAALLYSRSGLGEESVSGPGGVSTPRLGTAVGPGGKSVGTAQNPQTGSLSTPPQAGVSLGFTPQQLAQTFPLPNGQVTTLGDFLRSKGINVGGGGGGTAPAASPQPSPAAPAPIGRQSGGVLTAANDPNRPGANAPKYAQDAYSASVAKATTDVTSARDADSQYGNNMSIADQVRRLAAETHPGPGTPEMVKTIGAITSRFGGSQGVTDLQTLGSFLDRQSASLRGAMGLPSTNAGQEEARTISGNIEMQRGAILAKNSYNEALAQGLHEYRQGLDHVEGFSGNPSPSAVNQFKSAWASNFDPVAMEYKLAKQRGDKEAVSKIVSSLSPQQASEMLSKLRATDRLTQGMSP